MKKSLIRLAMILGVLSGLMLMAAMAQAPAPQSDDTMRALITELRQLRIAIENLTSANSRVSILAMRANQHEQRLSSLTNQLLNLKNNLLDVTAEVLRHENIVMDLQERLRVESDLTRRQHLEIEHRQMTVSRDAIKLKQTVVQAEVNNLSQQAISEQARLNEIQQRLVDEERFLRESRQNR